MQKKKQKINIKLNGKSRKYYTDIKAETLIMLNNIKKFSAISQGDISLLAGYAPTHLAQNISSNKVSKRTASAVRQVCNYIAKYPHIFEKPLTREEMLKAVEVIEGEKIPTRGKETAQGLAMLRVMVREVAKLKASVKGGSEDGYVEEFFDKAKLILDISSESA